jgi:hypothetical protein
MKFLGVLVWVLGEQDYLMMIRLVMGVWKNDPHWNEKVRDYDSR